MNKWIVRLIVTVAGIYAVNEVSWWWMNTPAWERQLMLSTAWDMAPTLILLCIGLYVGHYLALLFWVRRAKPVDRKTLSTITKNGGDQWKTTL